MKQQFQKATPQEITEFVIKHKHKILPDTIPLSGQLDEEDIPIYRTLMDDEEWLTETAKDNILYCLGQYGFSQATEELKRRNNYRKEGIIKLAGIFTLEECGIFADSYCSTMFTSEHTTTYNLLFRIKEGFHTTGIIEKIKLLDNDACSDIQLLFMDAWNLSSDYNYITQAGNNVVVNRLDYLYTRLSDPVATDGKRFDL